MVPKGHDVTGTWLLVTAFSRLLRPVLVVPTIATWAAPAFWT